MSSGKWLKALAIVLAIFAAGHTLGTAVPKVTRGAREAALFAAMQAFRFPVMGFDRSYWDFYRGFAINISLLLVVMMAMAWQLSAVGRRNPRHALPMAITLLLGCVGLLALSMLFFFSGPIVMSSLAVLCSAMAVVFLGREARAVSLAPSVRDSSLGYESPIRPDSAA